MFQPGLRGGLAAGATTILQNDSAANTCIEIADVPVKSCSATEGRGPVAYGVLMVALRARTIRFGLFGNQIAIPSVHDAHFVSLDDYQPSGDCTLVDAQWEWDVTDS
jgi:hypothetical protein